MADIRKRLTEYLRQLHLPTMRRKFEEEARRAERETLAYEQYLLELTQAECEERQAKKIERLLKQSRLPLDKSLVTFDLKRLPVKVARQYQTLLDGSFLERRENVLIFGAT